MSDDDIIFILPHYLIGLTCVHSRQQRRIPVVFSVNFFTQRVQQKPAQYILSTLSWASRIYCLKLFTAAGNYREICLFTCSMSLPVRLPDCSNYYDNASPTRCQRVFTVIDRVVDLGIAKARNTQSGECLSSSRSYKV